MNNDNLKDKVNELRVKKYGYKKIASELEITISAARHMCKKIKEEDVLVGYCENCGLRIKSIQGKKRKRFCSDKCRWQWWNKNNKKVNKKAYYDYECKYCKTKFRAYGNKNRVYCSHECYVKSKTKKGENNEA